MPKPLPVYQDYNLLQAALLAKCPSLVLSTTQQDFIDLLRNRGKSCPSQITISMTNTQGITKFAHASDFLQGHNRNMTDAEFQASMQQCSAKQKGNHVREVASIEMLAASFALHEFNLVDLTQDVESGAADGYLDSETETSFVGIQATRATGENRTGNYKIAESKEYMLNQVCELGFMFFGMLFVGDNWRGVLFLSPDDAALIRSLPNFKYLNLALGKNGIRIKKEKRNSLMAKLSKNIFLWDNSDNLYVQNDFMDSVKLFLSKANNRKHTRAEFFAMILYAHAVEYQYTLRFQQSVPTAVRMAGHSFGDISFDLEKIKVTAE